MANIGEILENECMANIRERIGREWLPNIGHILKEFLLCNRKRNEIIANMFFCLQREESRGEEGEGRERERIKTGRDNRDM